MAPATCNFYSSAVDQLPVEQVEIVTYKYKKFLPTVMMSTDHQ